MGLAGAVGLWYYRCIRGRCEAVRTKKCKRCGKMIFVEKSEIYLCRTCADAARKNGTFRERECIDCGEMFWGYPKSKRCPSCQWAANLASKREYKKRGPMRSLGSADHCARCGAEYVVMSSRQRYCKDCAAAATAENIRRDKREYNASRPDIVDKVREAGKGGKVCAVCGGAVPAGTASVTCSPTCAAEHLRRRRARADAKRGRQKQTKTPGGES